jgi:alcohol dehydrogenase
MKAALLSPHAVPRLSIVDPELTYTMPPGLTAMTGFDALTHGLEAFLNVQRHSPLSDLTSLETVGTVAAFLPRAVADGGDAEARAHMAWAATLGGMSIALSGATIAHAMGLPLGARLGVPHGLGLSRLEPVVLAHSWEAQRDRCARLADAVGGSRRGMDRNEMARSLSPWLEGFIERIGLNQLWSAGAADEAMLDRLTEDVFAYMGRPVQQHRPVFTPAQIRRLYARAVGPSAGG